jgi:hypothetical protein
MWYFADILFGETDLQQNKMDNKIPNKITLFEKDKADFFVFIFILV